MTSGRGLFLRVGMLMLVGLALAVGFVLFFTGQNLGARAPTFETYLRESVTGLEVGAPVRYRGVGIGRVTEIGIAGQEYGAATTGPVAAAYQLVLVRFAIDPRRISEGAAMSQQQLIATGLRVRLASQGVTGVAYLELDFVDPERFPAPSIPWTPRAMFVPSIPSTIAQVQTTAEQLLERLRGVPIEAIAQDLAAVIADLRRQSGTLPLGDLAEEARGTLVAARRIAESPDIAATLAETRRAVAELRELIGGPELRAGIAGLTAASAELQRATTRLPAVITQLEATLRTARGTTSDVSADLAPLLRDLRATSANLRDVTEQLRRSPSQTLLGAPPPREGRDR
jgi:ABC-type transporter Mla subunit MlaD